MEKAKLQGETQAEDKDGKIILYYSSTDTAEHLIEKVNELQDKVVELQELVAKK